MRDQHEPTTLPDSSKFSPRHDIYCYSWKLKDEFAAHSFSSYTNNCMRKRLVSRALTKDIGEWRFTCKQTQACDLANKRKEKHWKCCLRNWLNSWGFFTHLQFNFSRFFFRWQRNLHSRWNQNRRNEIKRYDLFLFSWVW